MKKTMIGLVALALLAPVLSNAAPAKHHVSKEGGNVTKTSQYRNTPNYVGSVAQNEVGSVKHTVGRNSQSDYAGKVTQYQNTPASDGQAQSWSVAQQDWQAKQPLKHHENRNK